MELTLDEDVLRGWVGRTETIDDAIAGRPAELLAATLDRPGRFVDGDLLPALWHWIYFLSGAPSSGLGDDGHQARGGFLPPVDLPRRMWAGGRLRFPAPLRIGDQASKTSTIRDVELKSGRSGPLCLVTVHHEVTVDGEVRIIEDQDLVYASVAGPPGSGEPAPTNAGWSRVIEPDPALLFRYSALTFNSHRIHYDRDYATGVDGYPGLVVHAPLTATLLAALAVEEGGRDLVRFAFRATSPLFDGVSFRVSGRPAGDGATVWAHTPGGSLAMQGSAVYVTD